MVNRESDLYELFAEGIQTSKSAQLLVRAEKSRNRKATAEDEENQLLWPCMEAMTLADSFELMVQLRQGWSSRVQNWKSGLLESPSNSLNDITKAYVAFFV